MTIRTLLTPLLGLVLAIAPVLAHARTAAPVHRSEAIAGKAWIPWAVAIVVIAAVAVLVAQDDKASSP